MQIFNNERGKLHIYDYTYIWQKHDIRHFNKKRKAHDTVPLKQDFHITYIYRGKDDIHKPNNSICRDT